jgi:agmatine deiminase
MKKIITFFGLMCCFSHLLLAQKIYTSAPTLPVRTMAEWEEEQAIAINWETDSKLNLILSEIVRNAQQEVQVIIVCHDSTFLKNAKARLQANNVDIEKNINFQIRKSNSIWIRDYGPNTVYFNDVDSLAFVDWRYNRKQRANDDIVPEFLAGVLKKPIFKTLNDNEDLMNTGGNFMADGMGTAFASKLVLDENSGKLATQIIPFATKKSEAKIDSIMYNYMGINRYIKMETLPFDGIHHIDMHIKLLDEETLLVGKYPDGLADGPQIEANIQYVLSQFETPFGKNYDIIRIPMPPDATGKYPNTNGYYRTYANAVFVNKTVLLPIYEQKYDTTAIKIWQKALPGHKIVGINCNNIISQSGAIHCITKEIGVDEPLWIAHSKVKGFLVFDPQFPNAAVTFKALIKHKSGIKKATIQYRKRKETTWKTIPMSPKSNDEWVANLSENDLNVSDADSIYYFVAAEANNGKTITRPLTGAKGAWRFRVGYYIATNDVIQQPTIEISNIYPNPAKAITCIEISSEAAADGKISLLDINGRVVQQLYDGRLEEGINRYFFDASLLPSGVYVVELVSGKQRKVKRVVVAD